MLDAERNEPSRYMRTTLMLSAQTELEPPLPAPGSPRVTRTL